MRLFWRGQDGGQKSIKIKKWSPTYVWKALFKENSLRLRIGGVHTCVLLYSSITFAVKVSLHLCSHRENNLNLCIGFNALARKQMSARSGADEHKYPWYNLFVSCCFFSNGAVSVRSGFGSCHCQNNRRRTISLKQAYMGITSRIHIPVCCHGHGAWSQSTLTGHTNWWTQSHTLFVHNPARTQTVIDDDTTVTMTAQRNTNQWITKKQWWTQFIDRWILLFVVGSIPRRVACFVCVWRSKKK